MRRFWSQDRTKSTSGNSQNDSVLIKYNKSTIVVHVGEVGDIQSSKATLGQLRQKTADSLGQTHPPRPNPERLTLVMNGKKLVGSNDEPLVKLGVKNKSKILCLVPPDGNKRQPSKAPSPKQQQQQSKVQTQLPPNLKIAALVHKVHQDLDDRIANFEKLAQDPTSKTSSNHTPQDEHRILSELVLQQLMNLDNIDIQDNPDARTRRKAAINELHQLHAKIDAAYNKIIESK